MREGEDGQGLPPASAPGKESKADANRERFRVWKSRAFRPRR
jgi:hypothetical protein